MTPERQGEKDARSMKQASKLRLSPAWVVALALGLAAFLVGSNRSSSAQSRVRTLALLEFEPVATGLGFITDVAATSDGRFLVTTKTGAIRVIAADGTVLATPFLDLTGQVATHSEHGLLSIALHPQYNANRTFTIGYSDTDGTSRVARYQADASNPNRADPSTAEIVFSQPQPFANHDSGKLAFGPDGFLYIALGDGGGGGDPNDNAQDGDTFLGSILRIDVDTTEGDKKYGIPADNPFVGDPNVRDEIWAMGLRNPWRFSFDRDTGELYIADVGQGSWEEINLEPPGFPGGGNYGWRCYEGFEPFNLTGCGPASNYEFPIYVLPQPAFCAVIGGHVYRGSTYAGLVGTYLFADLCSGTVKGIRRNDAGVWQLSAVGQTPVGSLTTFAEDSDGELYVGSGSGTIYKIGATVLELDNELHLPLIRH